MRRDEQTDSPLMTTREAARYLGYSEDQMIRWRQLGGGPPYVKFSRAQQGNCRYRRADLDAFIAAHVVASTSDARATG